MSKPRAFTAEEVRDKFLHQVRGLAKYWAELPGKTPQERTDGMAFSMLNIFDGSTMSLPGLDISLAPHPEDRPYLKAQGENWFKKGQVINDCMLHEMYFQRKAE